MNITMQDNIHRFFDIRLNVSTFISILLNLITEYVNLNDDFKSVVSDVRLYNASCQVKGAKRTIFYHITVILQHFLNKTIARSGDMYRYDLGTSILSMAIKCFGITNTS